MAVTIPANPGTDKFETLGTGLMSGLLGYWTLGDNSTTLADSHFDNDMTISGTGIATDGVGKIGTYALDCSGVDGSGGILLPANVYRDMMYDSFSIAFWVKMDVYDAKTRYFFYPIDDSLLFFQIYLPSFAPGRIYFRVNTVDNVGDYTYSSILSDTSNYQHVCCVRDTVGNPMKIYINGVDDTQRTSVPIRPCAPWGYNNSNQFRILNNYPGASSAIDGTVSEMGIWNRALSATEVSDLYNNGNGKTYPFYSLIDGLLGHWSLDQDSIHLTDSTGNENIQSLGAVSEYQTPALIDHAVRFTSTGALYLIDLYKGYPIIKSFTISMWLKIDTLPSVLGHSVYLAAFRNQIENINSLFIYISTSDRVYMQITDSALNQKYTYSSVINNTSTYFHVVCTCNGNGYSPEIYIDGLNDSQRTDVLSTDILPLDYYINIGNLYNTYSNAYKGYIDEIAIWNRSLSSAEVATLYNSGSGLTYPFS